MITKTNINRRLAFVLTALLALAAAVASCKLADSSVADASKYHILSCRPAEIDTARYQLGKDQGLILPPEYYWLESTGAFAYVFREDSVSMIDVDAKTGAFGDSVLTDDWYTKSGNLKFIRYGTERGVGWSYSYEITGNMLTLIDSRNWNTRTFLRSKIPAPQND